MTFVNHVQEYVRAAFTRTESKTSGVSSRADGYLVAVGALPFVPIRARFRYNNRKDAVGKKLPDAECFVQPISQIGGRFLNLQRPHG